MSPMSAARAAHTPAAAVTAVNTVPHAMSAMVTVVDQWRERRLVGEVVGRIGDEAQRRAARRRQVDPPIGQRRLDGEDIRRLRHR